MNNEIKQRLEAARKELAQIPGRIPSGVFYETTISTSAIEAFLNDIPDLLSKVEQLEGVVEAACKELKNTETDCYLNRFENCLSEYSRNCEQIMGVTCWRAALSNLDKSNKTDKE